MIDTFNENNYSINKTFIFLMFVIYFYFIALANKTGVSALWTTINFLLVFIYLFFGVVKFQSLVNPITILTPLLFGFYYYQFNLSTKQSPLSAETLVIIISFFLFYLFGSCVKLVKANKQNFQPLIPNAKIPNLILIGILSVFGAESFMNGGFPILITIIHKINIYSDMKTIPILHYLPMLSSIMPATYYFLFKNNMASRKLFVFVICISIFVLLNMLSRQLMIFGLISYFFVYIRQNNIIADKVLFKWILVSGAVFFILGSIRYIAIGSGGSELEYMKAFSSVPKELDVNMFDVTFNLYTSMNFSTLNHFVHDAGDTFNGIYTFKAIIEIFRADLAFDIFYPPNLDGFSLLATVIADPYLDFGLVGVIVFAFIYGVLVSNAYRLYQRENNLGYSLLWGICVFLMIMSVFTNFFNTLFIWICVFYACMLAFKYKVIFKDSSINNS
jgi:oligosaccharide repeat unit polymerase